MKTRRRSKKIPKQSKLSKEEANKKIIFEAKRLQSIIMQFKNKLAIERELAQMQGEVYKAKPLSQLFKYNNYYPELGKKIPDYVDYFTSDENYHLGLELVYDCGGNIYTPLDKAVITLRYRDDEEVKLVEITRGYDITVHYENLPLLEGENITEETFKKTCYPERTSQDEACVEKESALFKKICIGAQKTGYVLSTFLPLQIVKDYGLNSVKCTEDYKDHFNHQPNLGLILLTNRSNTGAKETNFSHMLYDLRKAIPLVKWMKSGEIEIYQDGELIEKYRNGELIEEYQADSSSENNQLEKNLIQNNDAIKSNEIAKPIRTQKNSDGKWVLVKKEKNKNVTNPFSFKFKPPAKPEINFLEEPKTIPENNLSYETERKNYAALYSIFAVKEKNNSVMDLTTSSKEEKKPHSKITKTSLSHEELLKQLPLHAQEIISNNYHDIDIPSYYSETYNFFSVESSNGNEISVESDLDNSIKNTF